MPRGSSSHPSNYGRLILRSIFEGPARSPEEPATTTEPADTGFTAPTAPAANHKVHARQPAPFPLGKTPTPIDVPASRTPAAAPRVDQPSQPDRLIKPRPSTAGRPGELHRKR